MDGPESILAAPYGAATDRVESAAGTAVRPKPFLAAGVLLGVGMGGFVDGILFHQILQIHNMLSAQRPPTSVVDIEINMVWDGLFHAVTWLFTLAGIAALFRAGARPDRLWSGRALAGAMLFGWGLFNLVEGVIDHHVLHLHHIVERLGQSIYDWAFLASGVLLMAIGAALIRAEYTRAWRADT
jgi:uncharacterized membrane protein